MDIDATSLSFAQQSHRWPAGELRNDSALPERQWDQWNAWSLPSDWNESNQTNQSVQSAREIDILKTYQPAIYYIDEFVGPPLVALGLIGNLLSFFVWSSRQMRHSSGCYLASLALNDCLFLLFYIPYYCANTLHYPGVMAHPVLCETYVILYMSFQYLSPLLALGFTVERWISICHPFQRVKYCTVRRALLTILGMFIGCLLLNSPQAYFWNNDPVTDSCSPTEELRANNSLFWEIYTWISELLIFGVVLLVMLLFNLLVLRELHRLGRQNPAERHMTTDSQSSQQRIQPRKQGAKARPLVRAQISAPAIMLLAVSFYKIIATLPVTITYALYFDFLPGNDTIALSDVPNDPTWQRYLSYHLVRVLVAKWGMANYSINFFIYLLTGKVFRAVLAGLLFDNHVCVPLVRLLRGRAWAERAFKAANGTNGTWDDLQQLSPLRRRRSLQLSMPNGLNLSKARKSDCSTTGAISSDHPIPLQTQLLLAKHGGAGNYLTVSADWV